MNDLNPETRDLLRLGRHGDEPSEQAIERNRRALSSRLVGTAGAAGGTLGLSAKAAAQTASYGAAKVALLCGSLIVGGGAVVAIAHSPAPRSSASAAAAPSDDPSNTATPTVPRKMPDTLAQQLVEAQRIPASPVQKTAPTPAVQEVPSQQRSSVPAPPPGESPAKSLQEEFHLVRGAQNHLHRNEPGPALELLREHARRFPSGSLAEERRASMVIALCQSGNQEAARHRAAEFVRLSPSSPFVERVKKACRAR